MLEVGPGGGRLTPLLRAGFAEYVGADVTRRFLRELPARLGAPVPLVQSDIHRLPFRDGTFSAVTLVRVYNFLVEPARALGEVARVLRPGGRLVVSYHAVPSIATLWEDVRSAMRAPRTNRPAPMTFARTERELPRRGRVLGLLRGAGLEPIRHFAVGAEDFAPLGWLPTAAYVGLARLDPAWNPLPHRFVVAVRGS